MKEGKGASLNLALFRYFSWQRFTPPDGLQPVVGFGASRGGGQGAKRRDKSPPDN